MEVDVDITDCAGGYATWTSIPEDCEVLAVEHEINLMAPVVGGRLEAWAWSCDGDAHPRSPGC